MNQMDILTDWFSTFSIQTFYQNYLAPVSYFNQIIVELANMNVACQSDLIVNQFSTRVSSFSGLADLVFTATYGYLAQDTIYDNVQAIMAATDCQTMGTAAGTLVVNLLNAAQDGTNY